MYKQIFSFELRYRFANPMTYLILLMMAGQGVWYAFGIYDHYTSDEALMNGAGIFYQCLAGGGMLLVAIVAMISGTTLHRDVAVGSADYVYACPLDEKRFFLSHFYAAFSINLLLVAAYPLGMVLIRYSGLGGPHLFGPTPWMQLIHGYLLFCIPNLFLLTAVCFFCLVYTRRMSAAYIGVTAVIILFVVSEVMSATASRIWILNIMDPLGYVYAKTTVELLPVAQKNSGFLPLTPSFWINRLLWGSIGAAALFLGYKKFTFQSFIQQPLDKARRRKTEKEAGTLSRSRTGLMPGAIPPAACQFTPRSNLVKVLRLAKTEFLSVVRPAPFQIIFGLVVFIVLMQNFFWNSTYYVGHQVPLTSGMCNVRLANGFLFIIILMLLSGELFFKERTIGFWQITGATPAPTWVLQVPKLLAMFATAFLFGLAIFLGGVLAQVLQGFGDIDLMLYLTDVFGYKFGWITYVFHIILVFFLAGLSGNRYLTHILGIGYYLFMIISFDIGLIEQVRYGYALTPGVDDYSEIMGYGIWERASFWFFLTWTALSLVMVLAGIQFWRRGTAQRPFSLKRILGGELPVRAKAAGAAALVVFFLLQGYIVANSNYLRNYIPSDQADAEAALYERSFHDPARTNQFLKEVHDIRMDLYPEKRKAVYAATLDLTNVSDTPADRLYLNADAHTRISLVTLDHQPLECLGHNIELGMSVYKLPDPFPPGKKAALFLEAVRRYKGFPQTGKEPQADLASNGLFLTRPIPFIGFDPDKSLMDNRDRETFRLKKLDSRLRPPDDAYGLTQGFVSPWLLPGETRKVNITVSTTAGQQVVAPGECLRTWRENDREYAFFRIRTPFVVQPCLGSARYLNHTSLLEGVEVSLLHHPDHDYNLTEFKTAVKAGIRFINSHLGPYPYEQLRIAEIPYHQEASYAMACAIALSEKEGWYADTGVDEIRGYIQFVLARDLIRQWLSASGHVADVQGADMLWTALPSALALQVVENRLGRNQVDRLFDKMRKTYRKDRNNEPNREPSLILGDHIEYLEANKGTMALYKLAGTIGEDAFNRSVSQWINESPGSLVFRDLYVRLKNTHSLDSGLCRLFETVEARGDL